MDSREEFKNKLKAINLKEFASKHYGVKWEGNSAVCCFPGHTEKTPSLHYKEENNYLSCFGKCQEKAVDIFKFVAIMENLDNQKDFVEIQKIICNLENISFPLSNKPVDIQKVKLLEEKTTFAVEFKKALWANRSGSAFNYLLNRGLTDETITTFHLGMTNEKYETRYSSHITKKEDCVINLSNRISIPILNSTGEKVIAMSFRDLNDNNKKYKYLHDSTDKVFNKKEVFYGYSHAIKHIREKKHCYIVEGYFDMISMYQSGLKNTLACMTNQMSQEQINILSNIVKSITIILDQDEAGINGFGQSFALMLSAGLSVRVVSSLNYLGKDINDMCNKLDWNSDLIQATINSNTRDGVLFYLSNILDKYDDNLLILRDIVMRSSFNALNFIADPISKKNYESYITKRLGI